MIPDLARDILDGKDVVLLSDGSATRTFCYAADAIAGYYKVLVRGRAGEPYNIGIEEPEISMADLAERIAALARDLVGYQGNGRAPRRARRPTTSSTTRRGAARSSPRPASELGYRAVRDARRRSHALARLVRREPRKASDA